MDYAPNFAPIIHVHTENGKQRRWESNNASLPTFLNPSLTELEPLNKNHKAPNPNIFLADDDANMEGRIL
jgi:hypothetical protein